MGLFSWFKKKQVEAQTPDLEREFTIQESGLEDMPEVQPKLKIKAILSNRVLTVFLPGGDVVINTDANRQMLTDVQAVDTAAEIKKIMLNVETPVPIAARADRSPIDDSIVKDKEIMDALPEMLDTKEFVERKGFLYLKGVDIAMPKLLAKQFINAGQMETSEYYDSLKLFWCWCVLNPDPIAREDTFGFLERGDFKITKNGFFLGYRNVVRVKEKTNVNAELTAFISDRYLNIKTKQKKSPKNFDIYWDGDGAPTLIGKGKTPPEGITEEDLVGNLADLYNGLNDLEDNEYTDAYTQKMKIKIGTPVKMERGECDNDPNSDCSRGLHVGNKEFGYQSFGNTTILVAINPMNVVAIPNSDANKMRVCEYMPLGVLSGKDRNWLGEADTLTLEEEYAAQELDNLLELAGKAGAKENEAKKAMGGAVLVSQVAEKLEDLQGAIAQRVVNVK